MTHLIACCLKLAAKENEERAVVRHLESCVLQATERAEERSQALSQAMMLVDSDDDRLEGNKGSADVAGAVGKQNNIYIHI